MRKLMLVAIPAVLAASPALAQSATGTVAVTGTVAGKCAITSPAPTAINLGELANTAGTVISGFTNNVGGLTRSFTVICSSANVGVSVSSDALNNSTDNTTGSGYTGRVHYSSTATADKAGGGNASATYISADVLPAASSVTLGDRLAATASNVSVTVSAGHTTNAADKLKAGTYNSTITVVIAPA